MKKKEQLNKRIKSLSWRTGGMTAVFAISTLIKELNAMEFSAEQEPYVTIILIILGLILGEVTKFLNNKPWK